MRPLRQPVLDDHIQASITAVKACHPETGHYGKIRYTGIETEARAREIVQGLFRAAKRAGVSVFTNAPSTRSSWPANEADGTWTVEYTCVHKSFARKYQIATHGTDRTKWAYSPIAGDPNFDPDEEA